MASNDESGDDKEDLIISYLGHRKSVGTIGVLLPIALMIATITNADIDLKCSISHFYYTDARPIFVGSLMIIGAFLGSYRGYPPQKGEWVSDRQLALTAALGAIVTALIPTDNVMPNALHCEATRTAFGWIHLISAALFLSVIGGMTFFKFSRSDTHRHIYRLCGGIIFAALGLIGCIMIFNLDTKPWMPHAWLFWLETIAVWAFGVSWLVKGKLLEDQYGAKVVDWFKTLT